MLKQSLVSLIAISFLSAGATVAADQDKFQRGGPGKYVSAKSQEGHHAGKRGHKRGHFKKRGGRHGKHHGFKGRKNNHGKHHGFKGRKHRAFGGLHFSNRGGHRHYRRFSGYYYSPNVIFSFGYPGAYYSPFYGHDYYGQRSYSYNYHYAPGYVGSRYYGGYSGGYYDGNSGSDGLLGAVVGGLIGGVIGREIDGGYDRTAGTVIGAAVGAVVGSEVAKGDRRYRYDSDRGVYVPAGGYDTSKGSYRSRGSGTSKQYDDDRTGTCLTYRYKGGRYVCTQRAGKDLDEYKDQD